MDMPILPGTDVGLAKASFLLSIQRQLVDRWMVNKDLLPLLQDTIGRQGALFGTTVRVAVAQASSAAICAIRDAAGSQERGWIDDYKASTADVYDLLRVVPIGSLSEPLWSLPSMVEMAWGPPGDVEPYGVDYEWLVQRLGLRATCWGAIAGKSGLTRPVSPVSVRFVQPWASMVKRAWDTRLYPIQYAVRFGVVRARMMTRADEWLRTIGAGGLDSGILPELSSPEVDVYGANPLDERDLLQAGLRIRRRLI
jgi:hypothetical protein